MLKPIFFALQLNYPAQSKMPKVALFHEIGWDDLIANSDYDDTCAIRLSLALVKAGIHVPGRMRIKTGQFKGKRIEPGQMKLSHILRSGWGPPERYKGINEIQRGIGQRRGVVSFFQVDPEYEGPMGHIDIVSPSTGGLLACGSECYWGAREAWFWPLK